jgi:flagellar hook-length control protein FliK
MMTQGVMTQAVNLFGNTTGSVTSKGRSNGGSFELLFDAGINQGQKVIGSSGNSEVSKNSKQSYGKEGSKLSDATGDRARQTSEATRSTARSKDAKSVNEAKTRGQDAIQRSVGKTDSGGKDSAVDSKTLEKIAGMLQAIKETVMEVLDLSEEKLMQLLAEQGFSMEDLLQPDNLQQLILANSGQTDLLSVITDEALANTMKQLIQTVEDLKTSAELGLSMDEVKLILTNMKQAHEDVAGAVDTQSEEIIEDPMLLGQKTGENDKKTEDHESSAVRDTESQKEIGIELVKTEDTKESASRQQSDLLNEEDQDLRAMEQFELFLSNLANASGSTQVDFDGNEMKITQLREIANQIIERIKVTIRPDQTSMELQLHPEHLGKVNFSVQSKNGVMTAQFIVQNDVSKEAIESQLQSLRDTLQQQGIKVEAIEVTVAGYSFEQNTNNHTGTQEESKGSNSGRKLTMDDAIAMTEDLADEDQTEAADITGIRGSSVDYTA